MVASMTLAQSAPVVAGTIYGITYQDLAKGTNTNLTTEGTLDWVKWGNGGSTGSPAYTTPEKTGGTIIDPKLTALGTVPAGQEVVLVQFAPTSPESTILQFNWSDGTEAMAGGGPVGMSVSETIDPAQFSYPLGLGASFQAHAEAQPLTLNLFVIGFNTRMRATATMSGGGSASLLAASAALVGVREGGAFNYYSGGIFSVTFSGAGELLTLNLTADNQAGVPTNATQYGFRNAGVSAATVVRAQVVPEPASLASMAAGLIGIGWVTRASGRRGKPRRAEDV